MSHCFFFSEDAKESEEAGGAVDGFAWIRSGHSLAQRDNVVYMFGGTGLFR